MAMNNTNDEEFSLFSSVGRTGDTSRDGSRTAVSYSLSFSRKIGSGDVEGEFGSAYEDAINEASGSGFGDCPQGEFFGPSYGCEPCPPGHL